jgi:DNA-binding NtrC family response regulator
MALHQRRGLGAKRVTHRALQVLQRYAGPGNVRELANTVERLMILSPGPAIDAEELPENLRRARPEPPDELSFTLRQVERRHIQRVLESTGRNRSAAARRLAVSRSTVSRKLKRWDRADLGEAGHEAD